jgi:hypothetical protein
MKKLILATVLSLTLALPMVAQFSIPKVVFEEFTGAWCQYCADGAYRAEVMDGNNENALMVAIHNGDAMEIQAGTDLAAFYSPSYPQALFNRGGALISRGSWNSTMISMLQGASSATVSFDSIGYNSQTRTITAVVRSLFTGPETGDMRMNLIITEDDVTGSGAGYNQVNADNNTPGHVYQNAGNPIVGFLHQNVARAYIDGAWGNPGVVPDPANFGTAVTQTFTYVIPAQYAESKIELVAYVGHYGSGLGDNNILNGEEFKLSTLTVSRPEVTSASDLLEIHGNPLVERSKIVFTTEEAGEYKMEVLNLLGQHIATLGEGFTDKGIHTNYWNGKNAAGSDVDNGIYLIRVVTASGQSNSKRILVAR